MNNTETIQIESIVEFFQSKQFWYWHGFVLSGLWVILSAFAILAKQFSIQLHLLLFMIIDITTLLFTGYAIMRVYPQFQYFFDWNWAKQAHVVAGIFFSFVMIVQHAGGVISFIQRKPNPKHRLFGKYIVAFGRIVSALGWIQADNINNAFIVAMASLPIMIISFLQPQRGYNYNPFEQAPKIKKQ